MKKIVFSLLLLSSIVQAGDTQSLGVCAVLATAVVGGTYSTAYGLAKLVKPNIVMNPYQYTNKDPLRAFVENAVLSDHQKLQKHLANLPSDRLQAMVRAHIYPVKTTINHAQCLRNTTFGIVTPFQTNQTIWITPENTDQFPQRDDLQESQWLHLARSVRNVSYKPYQQIDPAFTATAAQSLQKAVAAHEVAQDIQEEVQASRKQVTTYSPIVNDGKVIGHTTKTQVTDTAATKPLQKVQEKFEDKRDGHLAEASSALLVGVLHKRFHLINRDTPQGMIYKEMRHRASWADTIASYFRTDRYLQRTYPVEEKTIPTAIPVASPVAVAEPIPSAPSKFN